MSFEAILDGNLTETGYNEHVSYETFTPNPRRPMDRRQMQHRAELEAYELEVSALRVEEEIRKARKTRALLFGA